MQTNMRDALLLYADAFEQLASISAVLGGLSFTAAAAVVAVGAGTNNPSALKRAAKVTVATAMLSAVFLVFAALMWSLMAADVVREVANEDLKGAKYYARLNWVPSICLLTGTCLFFSSIGVSGWIASKKLGIITVTAAIVGLFGLVSLILVFADIK